MSDRSFVGQNESAPAQEGGAAEGGGVDLRQRAMQRRAIQRKADRAEGGAGPAGAPEAQPQGRSVSLPFGTFWVMPDGVKGQPPPDQQPITESEMAKLQALWTALQSNSGKIKISEGDLNGKQYGGFKAKVLERLGNLLSRPKGRELLLGLEYGGQMVIIRPSREHPEGGAHTEGFGDGKTPAGSAVELDPELNDDTTKVFDATGGEMKEPAFVILGHELIHARHIAQGKAEWGEAPQDLAYGDKEEEDTIADGDLTENDLRHEHGMASRYGHRGDES